MKEKIHPNYNVIKIKCSTCGTEYEIGSTAKDIKIDTCSNCHPFYTGTQTFVQAAGRVEKFNKRYGMNEKKEAAKKAPKKEEEVSPEVVEETTEA